MSFLDGPRPRVIAHRGLALDAPENTLLAFLKALTAGATHLETDVHASADGVAVVSHDPELDRVAGRPGRVDGMLMRELRRVELGHDQQFCSLAEALDTFPQARFNIDIKDERAAASVVTAIREARAVDRVLITSFSTARRQAVADELPGVATSHRSPSSHRPSPLRRPASRPWFGTPCADSRRCRSPNVRALCASSAPARCAPSRRRAPRSTCGPSTTPPT